MKTVEQFPSSIIDSKSLSLKSRRFDLKLHRFNGVFTASVPNFRLLLCRLILTSRPTASMVVAWKANADSDTLSRVPFETYMEQCTKETKIGTKEATTCAAAVDGHDNSNWVSALTDDPNILLIDTSRTMPSFSIKIRWRKNS